MKSSTQLDSVVFQLTPTRTRCDLVISANGKTEKMASGLLNPFLFHLKTAQEQMEKGGYSIILQLESGDDATWFTKGTVQRFVRFVNTPEILERVYSVESEILQIEEAIAIQSNNCIGLNAVEEHQVKPLESLEGSSATLDSKEEKAIVLYSPGAKPPETTGSAVQEGNSKVQLLKFLETRKIVLQKEQGMAFARAVAAGFDVDHISPLLSFAESFGASRLRGACLKFTELWKRKHETGQWLEIEAAEAMSNPSNFSAMNTSGIVFSENNGKAELESSTDEKPPTEQQTPGCQDYYQAQFPRPMFPPWPIHSPPGGMPTFQGYPMPGMPYYPNYPGGSQFFQQPNATMEDPRLDAGQRIQKWQSMDSRDSHSGSEMWEIEKAKSQDDDELENETSLCPKSRKKGSRSGKKQPGVVVIRNLNYITSKKQNSSGSDSKSISGSEMDDDDGDSKHKKSVRSSRGKGSSKKSVDALNSTDTEEIVSRKETHGGQWQAFQNYLLTDAEEEESRTDQGMFAEENEVQRKRRTNRVGEDPILFGGQEMSRFQEGNAPDMHKISAGGAKMLKASNDPYLISRRPDQSGDGRISMDGLHSTEIDGRRVYRSRRTGNDDFKIHGQQNRSNIMNSTLDPLAANGFEYSSYGLERSSSSVGDDSYIVPYRSTSVTGIGTDDQNAINMDSEFFLSIQKADSISNKVVSEVNHEPNDLNLMPERGAEMRSIGYDPAFDYEMELHTENKKSKEAVQGTKKSDKEQKSKLSADTSDRKKIVGPIRRGKPSKLSPLDEAKARAERVRTYKADLQKLKKEKEEAEVSRLEALKLERQKRIAARGSSIPAQQGRKQLPSKLSPSSHKVSKLTDAKPGSSSQLQRSIKTASVGSADSHKTSKLGKLNHSSGNRLTRSSSSLPDPKKDVDTVTPEAKVTTARIRRLSELKTCISTQISAAKSRNSEPSSKTKVSSGPESKKLSAIMSHDKRMIASLPELKIKTDREPDVTQSKSGGNEITQKVNGSVITATDGTEPNRKKDKVSPDREYQVQQRPQTYEVQNGNVSNTEKESSKFTSSNEKPYQPPFARVSSLEDPCTRISEYGKAPPTSLQTAATESENLKVLVPDSKNLKLEKIPEALDKPQVKDSSKGFRKLLKFGRKNHSSPTSEHDTESDVIIVNGSEADDVVATTASSSQVHALKNLISQGETLTASNTPQKSSRSFSLLSPFRSKNSEKKLTAT